MKTTEGTSFDVFVRNTYYNTFKIPAFGDHNVLNSLAVIALCHYEEIESEIIAERLQTFTGVKEDFRRKKSDRKLSLMIMRIIRRKLKQRLMLQDRNTPKKISLLFFSRIHLLEHKHFWMSLLKA